MERSVSSERARGDGPRERYSPILSQELQPNKQTDKQDDLNQLLRMAKAIRDGDLSARTPVQCGGIIAEIGDVLTEIVQNLKETIQKNQEQDWLKTNLAKFSNMLQGQRSISAVAQLIMSELTPLVGAQQGTFFLAETEDDETLLKLTASYAFQGPLPTNYRLKEGLVGQCAYEKRRILITHASSDEFQIASSLASFKAQQVILLPILFEGEVKAVIELASLVPLTGNSIHFLDQLASSLGVMLNMISSSMRTEELLQELKRSNVELEAQAKELEEKASQLTLVSKYKSEFLANMSHELRTPLNSLLILSKTLADNKEKNLTSVQVNYAKTVNSAGQDLLGLINEILDLSKVEAGKMHIDPVCFQISDVLQHLEQTFRPVAEYKSLEFKIDVEAGVPSEMVSDENRILQILKNLLANSFKFTDKGMVSLHVSVENPMLENSMLVFAVTDTGIGIAQDKLQMIFEAFQQADGTTSRKYGGTGLGLTISREIAHLLGGMIEVDSEPHRGSVFRLHLPRNFVGAEPATDVKEATSEEQPLPLPDGADLTGRKVLIVDDDVRNIFAMSSILKSHGIEVFHAENGKQGMEILQQQKGIELVLMDMMMPEMDGLQATRKIRENHEFRNLPIVSLTAKAMKGDREKCFEAGASDYLMKPVDERALLTTIYTWLTENRHAN